MGKRTGGKIMDIPIKMDKDFETALKGIEAKYGEEFEVLNGFHESQLNFSDFIDGFIDKNVADATIDANANARHKDICSMISEKGKSEDKMFAFNKIFYELKKKYGLRTAREWLDTEYSGGFYMHDAPSCTYKPYCFSGDTEILTSKGIKQLKDLVDKDIEVLNKNHGWEDAVVKSFGEQNLYKLTLERYGQTKEIKVTGNHIWFAKNKVSDSLQEVSTLELKEGMRIPFNAGSDWSRVKPSPFGVAHGFFIGDGDKQRMRANFCGDKTALIPYFSPADVSGDEREYQVGFGIPNSFKELPSLEESKSYLLGWLSGYFAADGSVDEKGRCTLSSTKIEYLKFVQDVLCVLGMPVNEIRYQDRVSNLTNEMGRVYILTLSDEALPESFFIRPQHKKRYQPSKARRNRCWIVKSVEDLKYSEEVYCAVVEGTQSFTLNNNVLTHNCYAYDLTRLAEEGLFFLEDYNKLPPKHLTTFLDNVIEFISFMSNRSSGACGLPNVVIWIYYFWKHDIENGYYIKDPDYYLRQCIQKFIYRLNQPFLRIDQSAFTNVSIFDRPYLESLFGGVEFPDGSFAIDQIEEIITTQKVFMEVVSDIRSSNMFTFPVLTYSLLYRDGQFKDEEFARWCSDHNTVWNDSNFFVSGDVGTLSNCCRLLSDTRKLDAFINSIGGTALSIGSVKVNTINLMRLVYETNKDKDAFFEALKSRAILCCKALDVVRHIIKRNVEKGLLPNYCEGGIELEKQYCTIGLIGVFETVEALGMTYMDEFGNTYYTEEGIAFASKIFDILNEIKDHFTDEYSINIENVPAERAAVILCQKDNLLYEKNEKFIYSNQWIPLSEKCTIKEKLHLSSILDIKCSGGQICHINLEKNFPNTDVAWNMLNTIAEEGVIYFAFNTRINECKNHHGFVGTDLCPVCGEGVYDTYQRIVGFLEPVRSYSKDRKREFSTRQWYEYAQLKGE